MSATGPALPAGDRQVDVLLATWSRPHTIRYAIEAVLQQSHADFTLHVVGDGCDDETERIVRSLGDPRVRFYRFPKAMGFGYVHRRASCGSCFTRRGHGRPAPRAEPAPGVARARRRAGRPAGDG